MCIRDRLEAVCVDINTNVPPLALAKEVTALTEALVIPAGSITPPVVMLFDKLLVIVPIILFRISKLFRQSCLMTFENLQH